jgi:hypothetical protein
MTGNDAGNRGFFPLVTFFFLAGSFLRLWHWSSQVLLDDEWHALGFVSDRTLPDVILQQGMGANSIPVNIYTWLLLHTTGWSESLLRLPSLIAGLAALYLIPFLVRRLWGGRVAVVTAALLAASPVVIFYTRNTRPYAPAMLFATLSVLLTLAWLQQGRRRDLLLSALCGSCAVYYHLYAVIPVCVPFGVAAVAAIPPGRWFGLTAASTRPLRDILLAGGTLAAITGMTVVLPNLLNPWWSHGIHGKDHASLETAWVLLSLLAGTSNGLLKLLALVCLLSGLVLLVRKSRTMGAALLLPFLLFALAMSLTTQDGSHAGIQVARYGIAFFPLSFAAIAVALVTAGDFLQKLPVLQRHRMLPYLVSGIAWCPFLATSPLWATYSYPNNFTNHSAYQYRYDPINWERSPERDLFPGISIGYDEIPKFYFTTSLHGDAPGIIEYPMLVSDHYNLYFYYQHFHRLPVVVGYTSTTDMPDRFESPGKDFVNGGDSIDFVMSSMPEQFKRTSSWRSMVDLQDPERLRKQFSGWLIIVHRQPLAEALQEDIPDDPMSLRLVDTLSEAFGGPLYVDDQLGVWKVQ